MEQMRVTEKQISEQQHSSNKIKSWFHQAPSQKNGRQNQKFDQESEVHQVPKGTKPGSLQDATLGEGFAPVECHGNSRATDQGSGVCHLCTGSA